MTALDTPYFRKIADGNIEQGPCAPAPEDQFRPYDLFSLKSRLATLVTRRHPTWQVCFETRLSEDSMAVKVFFRDEGAPYLSSTLDPSQDPQTALYGPYLELEPEERVHYQEKIWEYAKAGPAKQRDEGFAERPCAVLAGHSSIYLPDGSRLPEAWLTAVLPYVRPTEVLPVLGADRREYDRLPNVAELTDGTYERAISHQMHDGMLLVYLDENLYEERYNSIVWRVTRQLIDWYERGTLVCSAAFASLWSLSVVWPERKPRPITEQRILADIVKHSETVPDENPAPTETTGMAIAELLERRAEAESEELETADVDLFSSSWSDRRYGQQTEFLLARREGQPYGLAHRGNEVGIHKAVAFLQSKGKTVYVTSEAVLFASDSLEEFSSLFPRCRIQVLVEHDESASLDYFALRPDKLGDSQVVYYTDDLTRPWCLSTLND